MSQIIITYSLKPGISKDQFENWTRTVDYPTMRGLQRVQSFTNYRLVKNLLTGEPPSVSYVEIFEITDLDGFVTEDMSSETVQKIMSEFMHFADNPEFSIAEAVI